MHGSVAFYRCSVRGLDRVVAIEINTEMYYLRMKITGIVYAYVEMKGKLLNITIMASLAVIVHPAIL